MAACLLRALDPDQELDVLGRCASMPLLAREMDQIAAMLVQEAPPDTLDLDFRGGRLALTPAVLPPPGCHASVQLRWRDQNGFERLALLSFTGSGWSFGAVHPSDGWIDVLHLLDEPGPKAFLATELERTEPLRWAERDQRSATSQ